MSLTKSEKLTPFPMVGEVPEAAIVEPGANEAEAVPLTMAEVTDAVGDWTYSATAEDNGTAGILDLQPGITYNGPPTAVQVKITGFDTLEHAITAPEATDTAALTIFVNSTVHDYADEGFSTHAAEIAVEGNISTYVPLNEGDVLRVGVSFVGEEADADLDLAPGSISIV